MASFIACIWTQNSSSALTALCCCWTLNTVEPLSVTAAWSHVVSTSAAIFFITNWWMSKSLKVWIMTWKLARSKPGRGRAEMQGSSVPLGRNHVSPSGGPLPSWALRIVLTFPPFTAPLRTAVHFVLQSRAAVEFLPFLPCRPLSLLFLSTALPSSLMILLIFSHTNTVSHTHPHLKNAFAQANMCSAHTCLNAHCRVYRALNAKHSFKIWLWCLPSGLLV